MNSKLREGVDQLSKQVQEVSESMDSVATISLCLMESQCMQIRAEEQDNEDKQNIYLAGRAKTGPVTSGGESLMEGE